MLPRDLFGPAAEQRVHDRIAEIERERQIEQIGNLVASVTWQTGWPLTLSQREMQQRVQAERSDFQLAPDLHIHRTTMFDRVANILHKLGGRKRTAGVAQMLPDSLSGAPASSEV